MCDDMECCESEIAKREKLECLSHIKHNLISLQNILMYCAMLTATNSGVFQKLNKKIM